MPHTRRRTVYVIAAALWASGGLWLIYHHFMSVPDEFGFEAPHPLEKWWLVLHAAFAVWATWMFGNLWMNHIKLGWRVRARWVSGGGLFLVVAWLIASGFLLYYVGDPQLRGLISKSHWIPGLAALALFIFHLSISWRRSAAAKGTGQNSSNS